MWSELEVMLPKQFVKLSRARGAEKGVAPHEILQRI